MESLNEEVKTNRYTVFTEDGDSFLSNNFAEWRRVSGLQELIVRGFHAYREPYVAWAPDWPKSCGGIKSRADLFAESIAAGRLIEKQADGSFIPRGVGGEALFRVGGIYRAVAGYLAKLECGRCGDQGYAQAIALTDYEDEYEPIEAGEQAGYVRLADGKFIGDDSRWNLIPGELNEQGEPIGAHPDEMTFEQLKADFFSPIAATPPTTEPVKSLGKLLREQTAAQTAPEPCATRDEKGAERAAKWASLNKAKKAAEAAFQAAQDAKRSLGTARNPHPHWGAAVGLVK